MPSRANADPRSVPPSRAKGGRRLRSDAVNGLRPCYSVPHADPDAKRRGSRDRAVHSRDAHRDSHRTSGRHRGLLSWRARSAPLADGVPDFRWLGRGGSPLRRSFRIPTRSPRGTHATTPGTHGAWVGRGCKAIVRAQLALCPTAWVGLFRSLHPRRRPRGASGRASAITTAVIGCSEDDNSLKVGATSATPSIVGNGSN